MDYLQALHYHARREDPTTLRAALARVDQAQRDAHTPKRRRQLERRRHALRRRLERAQSLAEYDWAAGEATFIDFVAGAVNLPGVYERWRTRGVPIRVLLRAGYQRSNRAPRATT